MIFVAIVMVVLVGIAGVALDAGRVYLAHRQLQAAADSAALAAAQDLPTVSTATATACAFSASVSGGGTCAANGASPVSVSTNGTNSGNGLPAVQTDTETTCRDALFATTSPPTTCAGTGNPANAVTVTETASVPLFISGILGFSPRMTVAAKSTASANGGISQPLDIMVVLDATGSMSDPCNSSVTGIPTTSTTPTKLDCAKEGIRALLGSLSPCLSTQSTCGTAIDGNVNSPLDEVGLMVLPPFDTSYTAAQRLSLETDCDDDVSNGSYTNTNGYSVVPLSSDYRSSDTSGLNDDSNLVKSVYWGDCPGHTYPVNSGTGLEIGGGDTNSGSGDVSDVSNGTGGIGGGDTVSSSNGTGIAAGPSGTSDTRSASTTGAIGGGPTGPSDVSSTLMSTPPISGGPATATNVGTGTNAAGATFVSVSRPQTALAGDFVLVSVAANGLGTGTICAPDISWHLIDQDPSGTGSVEQATFWSIRSGTTAENYTFTFYTGASCSGTKKSVPASAIAIRYTGINTSAPIDVSASNSGTSAKKLTALAVTPTNPADEIIRTWATSSASLANGGNDDTDFAGNSTSSGATDTSGSAAQTTTSYTAGAPSDWDAQTIALAPSNPPGITLDRPANRAVGDFLLATLTATALGSGTICAPNSSWIPVQTTGNQVTKGTLTQASFYFVATDSSAASYTFALASGACGTAPANVLATATLVRYTGVNPTTPFDVAAVTTTGTSAALASPILTTSTAGDRVVRVFGTQTTAFSGTAPPLTASGSATSTGINDAVLNSPGTTGPTSLAVNKAATAASHSWIAQTIALRLTPSITLARPTNRTAGDFLLATITTQGLGSGKVCAPSAAWVAVPQGSALGTQPQSGTVTQATFYLVTSDAAAANYTFTFASSVCGGASSIVAASAVLVRYTGVDPANPIDVADSAKGTSATPTAPNLTTRMADDQVVRVFGTGSTAFTTSGSATLPTLSTASGTSATGIKDSNLASAGATGPAPVASNTVATAASSNWIAQTIALRDARTSITVTRPATPAAGDLVLVSVTAQGLNGGNVCAPDSTWTLVPSGTEPVSGPVTEATFYSFRTQSDASTYNFTFSSGACGSGTTIPAAASAIAVRYTGVDTTATIDLAQSTANMSGTTLTAPVPVSPTSRAGEQIVHFYGTGATSYAAGTVEASSPGSATATGFEDAPQASAGAVPSAGATSSSSSNWVAQTITINNGAGTLNVPQPANTAFGDFVLVSVTASGLGTGNICPPSDGTWTLVPPGSPAGTEPTSGAITQATFYSSRSDVSTTTYPFTFRAGSCSSGTLVPVAASAVAIRYTNVDTLDPIDAAATGPVGSSRTPSAPSVTPTSENDEVVSLYGAATTSMTGTDYGTSSSLTSTGLETAAGPAVGTGSGATTATLGSSAAWVGQTVALTAAYPCAGLAGHAGSCTYGVESGGTTYFTGGINAAEVALNADRLTPGRENAQPVIIFLSDGQPNQGLGSDTSPCHSAIAAADNTQLAPNTTWVFTIAYNATVDESNTCGDHATTNYAGAAGALTAPYGLCTMYRMADPTATCNGTDATDVTHRFFNQPAAGDLTSIFQTIGYQLTGSRLIQ